MPLSDHMQTIKEGYTLFNALKSKKFLVWMAALFYFGYNGATLMDGATTERELIEATNTFIQLTWVTCFYIAAVGLMDIAQVFTPVLASMMDRYCQMREAIAVTTGSNGSKEPQTITFATSEPIRINVVNTNPEGPDGADGSIPAPEPDVIP
jgi:hypothetical protein